MCCGSKTLNDAAVDQTVNNDVPVQVNVGQVLPQFPNHLEIRQQTTVPDLGVLDTDVWVSTPGEEQSIKTGRCLYSCDFAPCTPFIVFRRDPNQTWFRHCSSPFNEGYLENEHLDPTTEAVMTIGRPLDGQYRAKRQLAFDNFVQTARRYPNLRFIWVEIDTSDVIHVRVDGQARTIAISTNHPG